MSSPQYSPRIAIALNAQNISLLPTSSGIRTGTRNHTPSRLALRPIDTAYYTPGHCALPHRRRIAQRRRRGRSTQIRAIFRLEKTSLFSTISTSPLSSLSIHPLSPLPSCPSGVPNCKGNISKSHHTQQSPRGITRLRTDSQPVFRTHRIQLYVLYGLSLTIGGGPWDRVVGPEDFEGFAVSCCSVMGIGH